LSKNCQKGVKNCQKVVKKMHFEGIILKREGGEGQQGDLLFLDQVRPCRT
jgi:hypothetical protein